MNSLNFAKGKCRNMIYKENCKINSELQAGIEPRKHWKMIMSKSIIYCLYDIIYICDIWKQTKNKRIDENRFFICWSCILQCCWTFLLVLIIFIGLRFSIYKITSSVNRDSFISFFPIWMYFIYLFYLAFCIIDQARISRTVLIEVARVDIIVIFLVLVGKYPIFFAINDNVRCGFFIYALY